MKVDTLTYFGEFGGLVEFSFQLRLVMQPSAKLSSRQDKFPNVILNIGSNTMEINLSL